MAKNLKHKRDAIDGTEVTLPGIGTFDSSCVYLSSDEHLGHANIIQYTGRPYETIEEMNADIIEKHNAIVPKKNSVWICLGDFAFVKNTDEERSIDQLRRFVKKMNGETKILFRGNHDRSPVEDFIKAGFQHVIPKGPGIVAAYGKYNVEMRHRPLPYPQMVCYEELYREPNPKYAGDKRPNYMILDRDNPNAENLLIREDVITIPGMVLCGHVHQTFRHYVKGNVLNIGIDVWEMAPISFDLAMTILING